MLGVSLEDKIRNQIIRQRTKSEVKVIDIGPPDKQAKVKKNYQPLG